MMYISAIPWIFNIVLVGTIILLAGEIIVARKDEGEAYKQMLKSFEENEQSEGSTKETSEDCDSLEDGVENMDGKNMVALTNCIKRWLRHRQIDKTHPEAQLVMIAGEVGEIAKGLSKRDKQLTIDGISNTYVALVALCGALDLEIDECIYHAYKKIDDSKAKKVKMVDGFFGKEREL